MISPATPVLSGKSFGSKMGGCHSHNCPRIAVSLSRCSETWLNLPLTTPWEWHEIEKARMWAGPELPSLVV